MAQQRAHRTLIGIDTTLLKVFDTVLWAKATRL
jgi:hypothetical protein